MKINAAITFLVDQDGATITLHDRDASIEFAEVRLDTKQLALALSRLGRTPCECDVRGLDRVGLMHECKSLEFPMPGDVDHKTRKQVAIAEAEKHIPPGWVASDYYGSQDSFFQKDGRRWARTTIRRWVPKAEEAAQ